MGRFSTTLSAPGLQAALDLLLEAGEAYGGMWPSLLDRRTGRMPDEAPEPIAGQRPQDRALRGSNLMHDVKLVGALDRLAATTGEPRYREATDRYLRRFMERCTQTPSGLFAWGEHAYWDLDRDALGNANADAGRTISRGAYHDHLREAPPWLWERLWAIDADAVERFAGALRLHWKSGKLAHEYFRHAYIEMPEIPLPHEVMSRDFPRHLGFYLLDTAWVLAHRPSDELEHQLGRLTRYWWPHRHPDGLLPGHSRSDSNSPRERAWSVGQTLSLAVNMLEAAAVLRSAGRDDLASPIETQGCAHLEGCLAAPHEPSAGVFVASLDPDSFAVCGTFAAWGSRYGGVGAVGAAAHFLVRAGALAGEDRCVDLARQALRWAMGQPFPSDAVVYARDVAQYLCTAIDLCTLTGDGDTRKWIGALVDRSCAAYLDGPLPRAATGCDWYEAQLGSSDDLLAALVCAEMGSTGLVDGVATPSG